MIASTATYCNILQHTATYCNILQHTATYSNTLQHTQTLCTSVCLPCCSVSPLVVQPDYFISHTATHCNALKHSATASIFHVATMPHSFHTLPTYCNTLHYTATPQSIACSFTLQQLQYSAPPCTISTVFRIATCGATRRIHQCDVRHLTCMHDTHMMYPSL